MPRLTKDQRVWALWFPVQDIAYVKKDILSKMNNWIGYPTIMFFIRSLIWPQ
jgi:hypothetical protein